MTREPEWTDYDRARVLALMKWEAGRCSSCGNYDSLVALPKDLRHVTWDQHSGRKYEVHQLRCLACGAAEIVKRDWAAKHEKDVPIPGQYADGDGRKFIAQPLTEEV